MQRPLSVPCLLRRPAPQLRLSFSWRCPFFVVLRLPKQRKDFRDGHHVLELSILCMVWVGDRLGPQHSVGAVFILGYHVGEWNFLAGGRMHLIILLIVFVALAAIIIWVADWTSSPRSS